MSDANSVQKQGISYKPFTTAATGTDVAFWRSYIAARPAPTQSFIEEIYAFHEKNGNKSFELCHDVGTGPANIAFILASKFKQVVASDVNESALAAATHLAPSEAVMSKITIVNCGGEALDTSDKVPTFAGPGKADMVVAAECMPLIDPEPAMKCWSNLLKSGGTLAVYFYGRPIFTGDESKTCQSLYNKIVTKTCSLYWPFKGSPGYPFHSRSATGLKSWLDNIEVPASVFENVTRTKYNTDYPLMFNDEAGYDFTPEKSSKLGKDEKIVEKQDLGFWPHKWNVEQVKNYVASNYPMHHTKGSGEDTDIQGWWKELEAAMGGSNAEKTMTFPLALILATKK